MGRLKSLRVERFKAIGDAPFDLGPVNILVGSNNSGKSSIIQGLHFGVGLLQTILLSGNWHPKKNQISTSISPSQLIYSPSDDVSALAPSGKLLEAEDSALRFEFTLDSGEKPSVSVRKGRNRNILVKIESAEAAKELASLERPFSVFSPGLAGVSKSEQFVSDGVLLRTIARGDANLVLRNILLRLWKSPVEWDGFLNDLRDLFPGLELRVEFEESTDEIISVFAKIGPNEIPLELAGTGVLQAIQILAYIHRFSPSLVVLDEPDSHLHPNNQRLLCSLLNRVADERNVQVILTTHSRHVVDSIGSNTQFLWVRGGTVEVASEDDEVGVLLEIGALDVKERIGDPSTKVIFLTEDERTRNSEMLLESSGFGMGSTVILPYYGVTTIKQLRPLLKTISASNSKAKVILHRDRDYLTNDEVAKWEVSVRKLGVEPYVTEGVDIESAYLNAGHLAELNDPAEEEFSNLIDEIIGECREDSVEHYVNGRIDIARSTGDHGKLNHGQLAVEAAQEVDKFPERYLHGKTALKRLRAKYRERYGSNLKDMYKSASLKNQALSVVANKVK
jgi:ABC-type cobalamin/Fe3+-siderophores transport system ATPase subunit